MAEADFVVVGAGIAGLAVALALAQSGFRSYVLEKDVSFDCRAQGYGLSIMEGASALKQLGLGWLLETAVTSTSHFIFDHQGSVIAFWGCPNGQGTVHVPRQTLRQALLTACEQTGRVTMVWGAQVHYITEVHDELECKQLCLPTLPSPLPSSLSLPVSSASSTIPPSAPSTPITSSAIDIHFVDTRPAMRARGLIACDGIHSSLQKQVGGQPLQYLGLFVILGIIDTRLGGPSFELFANRMFQTSDGCSRMYVMPYSPGHSMWQLTFPLHEAAALKLKGFDDLRRQALSCCSNWHQPIPAMITQTPSKLVTGYPIYDRSDSFSRSEAFPLVLLAGDAAHCMSPLKGRGANQALLDSIDIRHAVVNGPDVIAAFSCAQANIRRRSGPVVEWSREACDYLHDRERMLSSEFHFARKGQPSHGLKRVRELRRLNVGATSRKLDEYAFGR